MTGKIAWIETYQQPSFSLILSGEAFTQFKFNIVSTSLPDQTIIQQQSLNMDLQETFFDEMMDLLTQLYQDADETLVLPINLTSVSLDDFSNSFLQALDHYLLLDEISFIEMLEYLPSSTDVESVPNDLDDLSYDELLNVVLVDEGLDTPASNSNPNANGDVSSISTPINLNAHLNTKVSSNSLFLSILNDNLIENNSSIVTGSAANAPFAANVSIVFNGSLINTNGSFAIYNNIFQPGGNSNFTPVVLDLDGNGIHLISAAQSGVSVAMSNGLYYQIGWIGQGSGILAFDPLLTGEVSSKYQIEFSSYVNGATTDLQGLSVFDTNNNNKLDSGDSQFHYFGVLDANGEFTLLSSMGIQEISLNASASSTLVAGNFIYGHSEYYLDGETFTVADVGFKIGEQSQTEAFQLNNIIPNSNFILEYTDLGGTGYKPPEIIQQPSSFGALGGEIISIHQSTYIPGSTVSSPVDGLTIFSTPEGNSLYFFSKDLIFEDSNLFSIIPSWHLDALFDKNQFGIDSIFFSQQSICECECQSENPTSDGEVPDRGEDSIGNFQFYAGDMFYFYSNPFAIESTPYSMIDGLRYFNIDFTYSIKSKDGQISSGKIEFLIQDDAPNVVDLSVMVSVLDNQYYGDFIGDPCDPQANHFGSNGGKITNVEAFNGETFLYGDEFNVIDAYGNTLNMNRLTGEFVYNLSNPLVDGLNNMLVSEFIVEITDNHGNVANSLLSFTGSNFYFPPIILDLDGTGLNLVSPSDSNVSSMMDNGIHHKIGWISDGSGILAYDPLQTGEVTARSQIQFTSYLEGAKTDLEGLLAFDSNQNMQLDFGDQEFNAFGVLDAHGNFRTLSELGIQSISLVSDRNASEIAGNHIYGYTEYMKVDGSIHIAGDVGLLVGEQGLGETLQLSDVMPGSDNILNAPDLDGHDTFESNSSVPQSSVLIIPFQSELAANFETVVTP